ncbi:MAG TPA: O-antigen translocase [Chitinophagaceae bacterium]|nr:O-antigen translocase [Chitinophagaceae bacterium]
MKKIINRVSRVAKTDFVKVTSWSAISTFVRMLSGIISTKIAAWTIGTVGMAVVGNFLNSINILSMFATGGIGQGVTKFIAEYYDQPEKQKKVIAHAVRITLVSTILTTLVVLIFANQYGLLIFKSSEYNSIIILFGILLVLYSFNMLFVYIINGFKQYRRFVRVSVISSIAALAVSVLLVLQFGLYGALLNCVLSQTVIIIVTIAFVYKDDWFKSIFRSTAIDWRMIRLLSGFTAMTLISTFMMQFSQLNVRGYISTHLSPHHAGVWEAMNRISSMYLTIVTTSISTFYLPRLAEIRDNEVLRNEIIRTMKIVLPPLLLACICIFLGRDIIIWVLFSKEFHQVRDLFAFQMIGDFLKMSSWLVALLFLAKAMTKQFIFAEVFFNVSWIVTSHILVDRFGLQGSTMSYAFSYLLYFLIVLFIFRRLLFGSRKPGALK